MNDEGWKMNDEWLNNEKTRLNPGVYENTRFLILNE